MRILILGAGAIGGYLGGQLLASGADVTFLVRPRRAAQLGEHGLLITGPLGELHVTEVPTVTADTIGPGYDLVVLSCKAYDLASAIEVVRPAMAGGRAHLLPLLNGMRHIDDLDAAFGAASVLGGTAHISVTLAADGTVQLLNRLQRFTYGPRSDAQRAFCERIKPVLTASSADVRLGADIMTDMWEKWVLLATLAGMTCLMRCSIGTIVGTDAGRALILQSIDECTGVATASGHAPRPPALAATRALLTEPGSKLTSSMLRDLEQGGRTEAEHIVGDLVRRGAALGVETPLLAIAHCHLQAYEAGRVAA